LRKALTLLELLVIVAIIGILAAISTSMYNKYVAKAVAVAASETLTNCLREAQAKAIFNDFSPDKYHSGFPDFLYFLKRGYTCPLTKGTKVSPVYNYKILVNGKSYSVDTLTIYLDKDGNIRALGFAKRLSNLNNGTAKFYGEIIYDVGGGGGSIGASEGNTSITDLIDPGTLNFSREERKSLNRSLIIIIKGHKVKCNLDLKTNTVNCSPFS